MSSQRWLTLGELTLVTENDGWTYLRRGPEETQHPISWAEACKNHPREARALLNEMQEQLDQASRNPNTQPSLNFSKTEV